MGALIVGISDLKIANPPDKLITYALGSCVGICLLDSIAKVGGMSHIMLPTKSVAPSDNNVYKFADTAIPELVKQMEKRGAMRMRIKAKIAGGAQMFGNTSSSDKSNAMWQIGQRNVNAVLDMLRKMAIPILAQDVLENYGRTVEFDPATGIMMVKSLNKQIKQL